MTLLCCDFLLMLLTYGCSFGVATQSALSYSPDHKHALCVVDDDEGALGGSAFVVLYSYYGLSSDAVYYGGWKTVTAKDVQWIDDSQVLVSYHREKPYTCTSAQGVAVRCVPASNTNN